MDVKRLPPSGKPLHIRKRTHKEEYFSAKGSWPSKLSSLLSDERMSCLVGLRQTKKELT